jgi:hypothetical protein
MKGLEEIKNSIGKIGAIEEKNLISNLNFDLEYIGISSEEFYNYNWMEFEEDFNEFIENHELSESDKDELEELINEIFHKLFELDAEYFNDDICDTIENLVSRMLDKIGRLKTTN